MAWRRRLANKLVWLSVAWFALTLSLVTWWWIHGFTQNGIEERSRRMLLWEGTFLLPFLFVGGVLFVYLTYHHQERHDRLRMFFSTFAHDLKTSLTRLRLQAELLEESSAAKDPKVAAILKDVQRLDLQLENSLWLAQVETDALLIQKTRLREVMDHLRNEFGETRLEIKKDAELLVDRRAFIVVLRNLFHNSLLHGKADRIEVDVKDQGAGRILLEVSDNGGGSQVAVEKLGAEILSRGVAHSNGLGLYLSRRLLERMDGRLEFANDKNFVNLIHLRGHSL